MHVRVRIPVVASACAWLAALSGMPEEASAAPRNDRPATCEPLRMAARQEPLSQLLRDLSAVRNFHLENWSTDDPVVTYVGGSDVELMEALSGQANLMIRYAAAKECPGQWKIETIWVLPARANPVVATPTPAVIQIPVPTPAEAAAAKAAMDMYMRAHGRPAAAAASAAPASAAASDAAAISP